MGYLLDTSVVSELRKRTPDPRVLAWYGKVQDTQLFLSALTLGEIRMGVERARRKDPAKTAVLETWLTQLEVVYGDRVVPVDAAIANEWGRLTAADPLPVIDGLLAATAVVKGWTLVTRNVADVERCGLRVLNPFRPD